MPKSKVRKKAAYIPPTNAGRGAMTPVKVAGPSHPMYVAVMLGLMLLGLAWLVVNYLAGDTLGLIAQLAGAEAATDAEANLRQLTNFGIGFLLIVVGLLMTMRWR
ncbi:MAG: cell division protein CrgA [Pseudonocardia sp.]